MKSSVRKMLLLIAFSLNVIGLGACTSLADPLTNQGDIPVIGQAGNHIAGQVAYTSYGNATTSAGEQVLWTGLEGKPLVLNFWAGSCPPCKAEMPDFQEIHEKIGDPLQIVGIDVGQFSGLGSKTEAQKLLDDLSITYETGYSSDPKLMERYGVLAMPTTIFIRSDGSIARKWAGIISADKLRAESEKLLRD